MNFLNKKLREQRFLTQSEDFYSKKGFIKLKKLRRINEGF